MAQKLKILHLEDLPSDGELVERELKKASISFEKVLVENKADFIQALHEFSPHIILSDHSLPSFDSQEALKTVRSLGLKIPFILVTATVSEEYAVNIMKEGASDYILKDRLQRLPNAVLSAIEKYNLEQKRKNADEVLRLSERKYKLLFESNPLPMWMINKFSHAILDVNEAAIRHYGYSKKEFLALNMADLASDDPDINTQVLTHNGEEGYVSGVWKHKTKNGNCIYVDILTHDVLYEDQPSNLVLANDITEKRRAEAELANHRVVQQKLLRETSIQAQEKERKEIGIELHDNINQILSSAKLYLESSIVESDKSMIDVLLNKSINHVGMAIREIRQLSHRLVAPPFTNIGLARAIREQLENLSGVTSVKIKYEEEHYNEKLVDSNIKLTFFRIVQEQLNNILKHANAKNGLIRLSTREGQTVLTIMDDGVGFDEHMISHGIGLRNIANRTELYNGSMNLTSAPGKGCTLQVIFPVNQ